MRSGIGFYYNLGGTVRIVGRGYGSLRGIT
jgi:hypothetical protein